jgi:periplasmic protein TonB
MSALTLPWLEDESPRDLLRWAIAAAIVLGIHAGVAGYFLLAPPVVDIGDDADAITVELAPIDSTPDAPASNEAPAPETMIESKAVPQPQEEKREETKVERPPEDATADTPEPVAKPPQQVEQAQPPAPRTAQQVKGGAPRIEPSWQTSLVRQLQRAKRYPAQAQARNEQGVVLLSFSLDRNGHVLAHRIAASSGYPDLDDEVMAMIMRAEPLPAFPPSMPQERLDLTVPIRFSIR